MSSIPLSPKHGLNASLDICFFCGKEKGIALLGKLENDAQAPKTIYTSYDPCDDCKKQFHQGITLIVVNDQPIHQGQYPINDKNSPYPHYPTGEYLVMKEESAQELFPNYNVHENRILLIDTDIFAQLHPEQ